MYIKIVSTEKQYLYNNTIPAINSINKKFKTRHNINLQPSSKISAFCNRIHGRRQTKYPLNKL